MPVTYALDGAVAVITLDDGKANAVSHDLISQLSDALDRAAQEATAVLLVGRPGRFSAGFDLKVMAESTESMRALVSAGAELLFKLFLHPTPVVAAVTGHAMAMGALLALAADRRIGAEGTFKVGLNEVAIGMPLPQFAVDIARYRMPGSAFDSVVLGRTFDPSAAVGAGYLDRVVPADEVVAAAAAEAHELSALRTGAVRGTKERARGPIVASLRAGLAADMATVSGPG